MVQKVSSYILIIELLKEGYSNASRWFKNIENQWKILKTEKNKKITSTNYLNWQNKLTEQNLNASYLVLYMKSAKDANATICIRKNLDLEFFVDYSTYVFYTDDLNEAFYLMAIMNSSIINRAMKDFQSKGHFGARNVAKKILDIYYPKFDKKNNLHLMLIEVSKKAHIKAKLFLNDNPPEQALSAIHLGRMRMDILKHISTEIKEIDKLVKQIIK